MNEVLAKAMLQAIQQRLGGRQLTCGMCGGTRWQSGAVVNLPVQETVTNSLVIGGKAMPLVPMVCEVCGFTQFHNIIRLIGKEKFDEIIAQQKESKQAIQEAEDIVKQGGQKDECTKKTD